ncbi:MAG TPA: hypothetical protein VID74_08215 [Gemmatimonadales bacterium]|jgi:hypothetical protein
MSLKRRKFLSRTKTVASATSAELSLFLFGHLADHAIAAKVFPACVLALNPARR